MATLTIINCHKPDEKIIFTSPMRDLEIKGLNKIQVLGGIETYQRRYLYLIAFDIVESDLIEIQKALPISSEQLETIQKHADKIGVLLKKFNISDIKNLSYAQADFIIKKLTDWKREKRGVFPFSPFLSDSTSQNLKPKSHRKEMRSILNQAVARRNFHKQKFKIHKPKNLRSDSRRAVF